MMKVAIGGSFSIYNKMIKLANELKAMGIEVTLPKHFQGLTDPSKIEKLKKDVKSGKQKLSPQDYIKIGKVETWFLQQIENADYLIILTEAIKEGKQIKGYIGINTAIDIAYALAKRKEVILTHQPKDSGIQGLYHYISKHKPKNLGKIKIMNTPTIKTYLKKQLQSKQTASKIHNDIN